MSIEALYFDSPVPSTLKFASKEEKQLYLSNIVFYQGINGKSAYESYLEVTEDNPPLTYVEWALLIPELKSRIEDLKIDINTLKSEADAVQEYDSFLVFPNVGASGIIFIDTTENVSYRWDKDLLKYYKFNNIDIDIIDGNF